MNIIILTIGRSGSTVLARMLEKLGWNLPLDADEYAEPVLMRNINERMMAGLPVPDRDIEQALSYLKPPWVLKDPRFCWTLREWGFLEGTLLLWLARDLESIEKSMIKAGWGYRTSRGYAIRGATLETIETWCQDLFEDWQGPKAKIAYEKLHEAVSLFDLSRG